MNNATVVKDAKVLQCGFAAEGIVSMVFECPDIASAVTAGQFVHIACGEALLLRRPVSVCETVDSAGVRILFEIKGEGTRWLSQCVSGDIINVMGPLGNGFGAKSLRSKRILIAGGGIGVPPLLLAAKSLEDVSAVLGFASEKKAVLLSEFKKNCETVDISTDDGSIGKKGFVTELLSECLKCGSYDMVLACGPRAMLKAVSDAALLHGVSCRVSMEERMGCGTGACLVCACETNSGYKRVCKDGPVFDAREVFAHI